jgi:hypothetical protein
MTEATRVNFETLSPVSLYIPGPNARRAGAILDRIRDLATDGRRFMRYADDADIDPIALEVVEEAIHRATRPMRRALEAHNSGRRAEIHAQQFAADMGAPDTEETDDDVSTSPERHP